MIKNRIKEIAENNGIKLSWVAKNVGCTPQTVYAIAGNQQLTDIETAFIIARCLKVPVEELWYFE